MPETFDPPTGEATFPVYAFDGPEPLRMLLVVTAAATAEVVDLASEPLTIGRGRTANLIVNDRSLSRQHARFERQGDRVRVVDLGSRNGTVVNGKRVADAHLLPGDVAVLGSVVVSVQLVASPTAAVLGVATFASTRVRLAQECARARALQRPLSVVFVRAPQAMGADTFAPACLSRLRPSDHAGIYDGHSLVVLLPEMDARGAEVFARGLVDSVAGAHLVAGVASYPEVAFTPDQLMTEAMTAATNATSTSPVATAPSAPLVRISDDDGMIRRSPAMIEVQRLVERIAPRSIPVLVLGETGTGKELIARELHRRSARGDRPLRVVNCAAIPHTLVESVLFGHVRGAFTGADRGQAGVFEQASGGTVFLDEVGELSASAQAALLRAVETGRVCPLGGSREIEVDVRLVSATHRRLEDMVEAGTFRLDLYHRLNAFTLELPPLRERLEEIAPLAREFARRLAEDSTAIVPHVTDEALDHLLRYSWPGNVRELRNVIERALALADDSEITSGDLPEHIRNPRERASTAPTMPPPADVLFPEEGIDLRAEVQAHEATLIRRALERSNGHQRRAAELLRIPLRTLERKVKDLALRPSTKFPPPSRCPSEWSDA